MRTLTEISAHIFGNEEKLLIKSIVICINMSDLVNFGAQEFQFERAIAFRIDCFNQHLVVNVHGFLTTNHQKGIVFTNLGSFISSYA